MRFDSLNAATCALGVACVALMLLAGCGGPEDSNDNPGPQNQTIAFVNAGPLGGPVGTTITNTAFGGGGTGAINYASSNIAIATVDSASGMATLLSVGSVTITATKAASTGFNATSASYALTVTATEQTIFFSQAGPLAVSVGATLTNTASGGSGLGVITYASSNPSVATVDPATGVATVVALGSAVITATKTADANYQQAQVSYTLNVVDATSVSAWVGTADTLVTLSASANGADFIRSRDRNCSLLNYSTCSSGQSTTVSGAPTATFTDTAAIASMSGYYWLRRNASNSNPLLVASSRFSERLGHSALFYNNRYWVIGGSTLGGSASAQSDIWSSSDGRNWYREAANPFGARWLHQSLVYAGRMWVISGVNTANNITSNVMWSFDGVNWTQAGTALPGGPTSPINLRVVEFNGAMWAVANGTSYSSVDGATWTQRSVVGSIGNSMLGRGYATLTVYNNRLWYLGGAPNYAANSSGTAVNDVWNSTDGVTWTQVTANATYTPRFQHSAFVLNNRLWIFGGRDATNGVPAAPDGRAWSTTDGITWIEEGLNTQADEAYLTQIVQEPNKVTLIAGVQRLISNNVYQSTDGSRWNELSSLAQFSPRVGHRTVSFGGELWTIGGMTFEGGATNEIWRSSDGISWSRVEPSGAVFSRRQAHQVVVFNGRMWVIGGWDELVGGGTGTRLNDVWSSSDGVTWRRDTASAAFAPRQALGATAFNNRLWVVGGEVSTGTRVNDVWWSTDGANWTQATANAAFAPRYAHSVVAFNNMLWTTGGSIGAVSSEVWTSTDGVAWTQVPATGPRFAARAANEMVVYNNRLFLVGGSTGAPYPSATSSASPNFNDVWSTVDGATWMSHTAAAPFDPRQALGLAVHNNELWVVGGFSMDRLNDVWRSTDGANWRVGYSGTITFP